MYFFNKKKPFYLQKKGIIFISIIAFLVVLRMVLPTAIKIGLNNYLKDFSPAISLHVKDVDLAILRGVYTLEGITAEYKKNEKNFLDVKSTQASVAWRDLLKGTVAVDVFVNTLDFTYSDELLPALKEHQAYQKKKKKSESENLRMTRLDIKKSIVRTDLFPSLTKDEGIVLTDLEVRATNLIPSKRVPLTHFSFQALLLGSGQIKTEGEADLTGKAPKWTIDSEMKAFELNSLNRFLKKNIPLTFTKGQLDLYLEAATQGGPIKGYIKPFVKNLDVIRSKENFLNTKHWLIEIVSALGNVVMKADETMATRVSFIFDKTFKPESGDAISKAFEHGFMQELNRGVEHSIGLNPLGTKQSQEESHVRK